MADTHIVFNDQLEEYTGRFISGTIINPDNAPSREQQERELLALVFEQLLLFDKLSIKLDRQCHVLYYLIQKLGINKVEELIDHGILIPVLWTPIIATSTGMQREDGSIDHDAVLGRPPLVAGQLGEDDSNPEYQVDRLLSHFQLDKDRKRIFKKRVRDRFVKPDNNVAGRATEIVANAYEQNRLADFGLPAVKDALQLDYLERGTLLSLGNQVLETSVLAEKGYKTYDQYSSFAFTHNAVKQIESALNVSENTSSIFNIEGLANIRQLVLENKIPFDRIFEIRYQKNIKAYRKWINSVSSNENATPITKEYIDEIMGKNNFFESAGGKYIRTMGMIGVGTGIGAAMAGPLGGAVGAGVGKIADLGLSLFDNYVLNGLLRGWNPQQFVDSIRMEAGYTEVNKK